MAITTQITDYFDDLNFQYSDGSHLDKNYLRVLFKPGRNVQTRELNQAQSILQAQLDRLGNGLFKPNSPIVGGECTFDNDLSCVTVDVAASANLTTDLLDTYASGDLTLVKIKRASSTAGVTLIEKIDGFSTIYRIFFKNQTGVTRIEDISTTDELVLTYGDITNIDYNLPTATYQRAVGANINAGIYFVKGCMVASAQQYAARTLTTEETLFNGSIVLEVSEVIVTSNDDSSLLDNASNAPNFAGVGADRYQINLVLKCLHSSETPTGDFVKIADVRGSEVFVQYNNVDLTGSNLEDILAKRTYEESGDYSVKKHEIELQEVFGNDYLSRYSNTDDLEQLGGLTPIEAEKHFAAVLSPGISYVRGRRVETLAPLTLLAPKARMTYSELTLSRGQERKFDAAMTAKYGNYVIGYSDVVSGLPLFSNNSTTYDLLDSLDDVIGSTKIVSIEPEGDYAPGQIRAKVYLYDISLNSGKRLNDIAKISGALISGLGAFDFTVESANSNVVNDIDITSSLFEFPNSAVKDVKNLRVSRRRIITATASATPTPSITLPAPTDGSVYDASRANIVLAKNDVIITTGYTVTSGLDGSLTLTFSPALSSEDTIAVLVTTTGVLDDLLGSKIYTTETVTVTTPVSDDVYELPGVFHAISVEGPDWILVDDGQRDNSYVSAKVRRVSGDGGSFDVNVTHWKFDNLGSSNYYTVNSYVKGDPAGQAPLEDIPTYKDLRLSDVFDTRIVDSPLQTNRLSLDPYSAITAQIDFYLPRIDLVCVYSSGEIGFVSGKPDIDPQIPNTPDNAMTIHICNIPAYTIAATDIETRMVDNRRYTMADIGKIEKRIGAVEYYTSLSLLEKDANERSVFGSGDDGFVEKFKNGFVTDAFRNFEVGDTENPEFLCSMDSERGICYPYHKGYSVPFKKISDVGARVSKNQAFLNYSETTVSYLTQDAASQFIDLQPHEQSADVGIMQLTPEVDTWSDTARLEDNVVNITPNLDSTLTQLAQESGLSGTDWNGSWVTTSSVSKRVKNKKQYRKFLASAGVTGSISGSAFRTGPFGLFRKKKKVTIKNQTQTGIETQLAFDDIQESLGEYVQSLSVKPWMRSRSVLVEASGLKPNAQFYAFFDGKNVSDYVKILPSTYNVEGHDVNGDEGLSEASLLAKYATSAPLLSDSDGHLLAMFIIPNNNTIRFSTGEKTFKLSTSPRDQDDETDSFAHATFIANGLDSVVGENILSTRVPRISRQTVTRNRFCIRKNDPIAQTFRVEDTTGIFATSIDLAFASKPVGGAPVQVYLVTVLNGYPTDNIVPGSETTLTNSEILTSSDSNTYTRFTFEHPIYLEPNVEYAVVAFSGSYGYKAYISELGRPNLVNGGIISEQPAVGVFFTSANKTTWTAYQNRDMKFKIQRAQFETTQATLLFNPVVAPTVDTVDIDSFTDVVGAPFENISWKTSQTTAVVSLPDAVGGVRATCRPIFSQIDSSITGFRFSERGYGYTTTPTVTVEQRDSFGVLERSATFAASLPSYKIGAFNLNEKFVEVSGRTRVDNILEIGSGTNAVTYAVEPGEPVENIINPNFAIGKDTVSSVVLRLTLSNDGDDRLSPVVDLSCLSLQTREYAVASEGSTSRYFTKSANLVNSADQLDVFLDVNRPTSTSNIRVFGRFYDENNLPIQSKYFTRSSPNAGNRFATVTIGWRLRNASNVVVATVTDIQRVGGIWRYYYDEIAPINTTLEYNLVPASSTVGLIALDENALALPAPNDEDWIELVPVEPINVPVNSDRTDFDEVKFNVNPSRDFDFKQFTVKIEFRGSNYNDAPTIKNLRAIASL